MGVHYLEDYDNSGRKIVRQAATEKGNHYQAMGFEITTSTGVVFCEDAYGNDLSSSEFAVVRYDNADQVTTDPALTVKTVVTWQPSHDYEIIAGNLHQSSVPTNTMRLWAIGGATDLGAAGSKEFIRGLNLNEIGTYPLDTDGRASKFLAYSTAGVPVPTNKFQFIFKHTANEQHTLHIVMEIFKA